MEKRFYQGDRVKHLITGKKGEVFASDFGEVNHKLVEIVEVYFDDDQQTSKTVLATDLDMIGLNHKALRIYAGTTLLELLRMGATITMPNGAWLRGNNKSGYIEHGTLQTPAGLGWWHLNERGVTDAVQTIEEQLEQERGEQ
jgi:hypothetical protein